MGEEKGTASSPLTLISANGLGTRLGCHALDQACITHVRVLVVKILYFKILYIEMCVKTIDHYTTPDHMYNFRPYIGVRPWCIGHSEV